MLWGSMSTNEKLVDVRLLKGGLLGLQNPHVFRKPPRRLGGYSDYARMVYYPQPARSKVVKKKAFSKSRDLLPLAKSKVAKQMPSSKSSHLQPLAKSKPRVRAKSKPRVRVHGCAVIIDNLNDIFEIRKLANAARAKRRTDSWTPALWKKEVARNLCAISENYWTEGCAPGQN